MKSNLSHLYGLVVLSILSMSACAESATPSPTIEPTATDTPTAAPTETSTPSPTATETLTPTSVADAAATAQSNLESTAQAIADQSPISFPLAWPMELSAQQVDDAKACDIWTLYDERYADVEQTEHLAAAYEPQTPCDWAVLAAAYVYVANDQDEPIPDTGKQAYLAAISQNPALVLLNTLFFCYLDEYPLVEAPPFTDQPIITAQLHYTFGGIGYQSDFTILITAADTSPIAQVTGSESDGFAGGEDGPLENDLSSYGPISTDLAQQLGRSLSDLVPVESQFEVISCYDYYPDWTVTLTFADGTSLQVVINDSNLFGIGGPWQLEIDGQNYVQASGAFADAVDAIMTELELPRGSTAAMSCFTPDDLIYYGYPN